jgi:hypothetical protein
MSLENFMQENREVSGAVNPGNYKRMRYGITSQLAAAITHSASKQTCYTIRLLVDRERIPDAYQAYAYFRWLDDRLDQEVMNESERIAFADRQTDPMNKCYAGK